MTRGALRATHQLKSKIDKNEGKKGKSSFLGLYPAVREGKRGCRERSSNFSLRSMKIGWSSSDGPRVKIRVLDEGYAWRPETQEEVFAKLPWVISHTSRDRDYS